MLGMPELMVIMLASLQIVFLLLLPLIAWVALYRKGAPTRDMIFWGVIALLIPLLGPIAALLYLRRRGQQKQRNAGEGKQH